MFVYVVFLVCRGEDLGLVDIVNADGLENLAECGAARLADCKIAYSE